MEGRRLEGRWKVGGRKMEGEKKSLLLNIITLRECGLFYFYEIWRDFYLRQAWM